MRTAGQDGTTERDQLRHWRRRISAFQALTVAAVVPIPVQSFDDVDLRDKAEVPLRSVDG
jgi:hypothetical protein